MRHHKQKIELALQGPRGSTADDWDPVRPSTVVLPGEEVTAVVRVTGDPDDKVSGATAKLVCCETWMEVRSYANIPDAPYENNPLTVAAEVPVVPTGAGDHPLTLAVPPDALPTAQSHDFWDKAVDWRVDVVINRRHGFDPTAHAAFTVAAPADREAAEAQREPVVVGDPFFNVRLASRSVRSGGTVTGSVVIAAGQDMEVGAVEALLELHRQDGPDLPGGHLTWDRTKTFRETTLAAALALAAGESKELPFELTLPADATPTLHTQHCSLEWSLVTTGGRSTDTARSVVSVPLQVHNDPRTTG